MRRRSGTLRLDVAQPRAKRKKYKPAWLVLLPLSFVISRPATRKKKLPSLPLRLTQLSKIREGKFFSTLAQSQIHTVPQRLCSVTSLVSALLSHAAQRLFLRSVSSAEALKNENAVK